MVRSCPSILARYVGPAFGLHQLRPAPVELAVVALAHAEITGPGVETLVEPLVSQPHLRIQESPPGYDAAASARALLPIVHVILLEGAGRAEAAHAGQPDGFLDVRWRRLVGEDPRPHLGLVGSPRLPHAEGARGGAQHREIGEHRADDRIDQRRSRSQAFFDLGPDLLLVVENFRHWRIADIFRPDANQDVTITRGNHASGSIWFGRDACAERGFDRR